MAFVNILTHPIILTQRNFILKDSILFLRSKLRGIRPEEIKNFITPDNTTIFHIPENLELRPVNINSINNSDNNQGPGH